MYVPGISGGGNVVDVLYRVDLVSEAIEKVNLNLPEGYEVHRPTFSPIDTRIVLHITPAGQDSYVATYDPEVGVFSKRTFTGHRRDADWSPDGTWLYYDNLLGGIIESQVYRRRSDGSGTEEKVLDNSSNPALSPDGKWLAIAMSPSDDPFKNLVVHDQETGTLVAIDTVGDTQHPEFSPDSRFVVYASNRGNVGWRIAVRTIADEGYFVVSDMTGQDPKWSSDGKFIYFSVDGEGIYRVPVSTRPSFAVLGVPERIISLKEVAIFFDINQDGTQLVIASARVPRFAQQGVEEEKESTLVWWQNWAQTLTLDGDR
jgi:Tol biopolymer transport system component